MATKNSRLGIGVSATGIERTVRDIRDVERSIKAVPETTVAKIDADIARFRVKALDVQEKLEKLSKQTATPRVELETAAAQAQLKLINAQIDALSRKRATVKVDVDKRGLDGLNVAASATGGLLERLGDSVLRLGSSFTSMGTGAAGVASGLVKASAAALVLAEVGAGVTAAWGAASTAIAAVPALIGAIAVPLGAVTLGMDGIKKAAAKIKPQFDALKKSVSAAFEKGLTPVLQKLANELFPKLGVGLSDTATALSFVASELTNFITNGRGVELLATVIGNVNRTLREMAPGLVSVSEGFLRLAGNKAALDVLKTAVESVGRALNAIADNPALNEAFRGLSGLVDEATNAFTNLVNNGIKVFAAAAPGATEGLKGISDFFGKFDWQRLGAAAGNALRGLGDAVKGIPPATVASITTSFEKLGTTLSSPEFQGGLQAAARLISPLVDALNALVTASSRAATELDNMLHPLEAFSATSPRSTREAAGLRTEMDRLAQGLANNVPGIEKDLGRLPPILQAKVRASAEAIRAEGGGLVKAAGEVGAQVPPAFLNPLAPLPGMVGQIFGQVPPAAAGPLQSLQGIIQSTAGPAPTTLAQLLNPMAPAAAEAASKTVGLFGSGLGQLTPTLQQQLGLLPPVAQTGFQGVTGAVQPGLAGVGPAVTTGLAPAQAALTAGLDPMVTQSQAAMAQLQAAFGTGFAAITPQITAFQTALTGLNPVLVLLATNMGTLGPLFTQFGADLGVVGPAITQLSTDMAVLGPLFTALTTDLSLLGPIFTQLGADLAVVGPAFTQLATDMAVLGPLFTQLATDLTTLGPLFTQLGVDLGVLGPLFTQLGTDMAILGPLITQLTTDMSLLGPIFTQLAVDMAILGPLFTQLAVDMQILGPIITQLAVDMALLGPIFTQLALDMQILGPLFTQLAVDMQVLGPIFTQLAADIQVLGPLITQLAKDIPLLSEAMPVLVQSFQDAATAIPQAMQKIVDAVKQGIADAKREAEKATEIGTALTDGLIRGIEEGRSGVIKAAVDTAIAAYQAAKAALDIGSPSKKFHELGVYSGLGMSNGLDSSVRVVEASAAGLAQAATRAANAELGRMGLLGWAGSGANIGASVVAVVAREDLPSPEPVEVRISVEDGAVKGLIHAEVVNSRNGTRQAIAVGRRP